MTGITAVDPAGLSNWKSVRVWCLSPAAHSAWARTNIIPRRGRSIASPSMASGLIARQSPTLQCCGFGDRRKIEKSAALSVGRLTLLAPCLHRARQTTALILLLESLALTTFVAFTRARGCRHAELDQQTDPRQPAGRRCGCRASSGTGSSTTDRRIRSTAMSPVSAVLSL